MRPAPKFETEADLCAAFITTVKPPWIVYPETGGYDMLLVNEDSGWQIGVEAKLRLSAEVIKQSIPGRYRDAGPDFHAVLVPKPTALSALCDFLGVTVIWLSNSEWSKEKAPKWQAHPAPPAPPKDMGTRWWQDEKWVDHAPEQRLTLPIVVPDVTPGLPSPSILSGWKIQAIKMCILLDRYGFVTTKDFKDLRISNTLWMPTSGYGWLAYSDTRGRYIKGPNPLDLRAQHPRNYDEIAAMIDDWLPKNRKAGPLL